MTFTFTLGPPRVARILWALAAREYYRAACRQIDRTSPDVGHVRLRFLHWSEQLRSLQQ